MKAYYPLHRYSGGGLGWGLLLAMLECKMFERRFAFYIACFLFCILTPLVRAPSLTLPRSTGGGNEAAYNPP
jgi:hypothetical protein